MDELQGLFEHLFDSASKLADLLYTRTTTNLAGSVKQMSPQQWIRLVAIVGAYCLLRPYVMRMASRHQEKQMVEAEKEAGMEAEITPNQLRGQAEIPEDSSGDDDGAGDRGGKTTAADWGKKARRRQRHMIKKLLDAEEERLRKQQEDDEDKDIEQYLVG